MYREGSISHCCLSQHHLIALNSTVMEVINGFLNLKGLIHSNVPCVELFLGRHGKMHGLPLFIKDTHDLHEYTSVYGG